MSLENYFFYFSLLWGINVATSLLLFFGQNNFLKKIVKLVPEMMGDLISDGSIKLVVQVRKCSHGCSRFC